MKFEWESLCQALIWKKTNLSQHTWCVHARGCGREWECVAIITCYICKIKHSRVLNWVSWCYHAFKFIWDKNPILYKVWWCDSLRVFRIGFICIVQQFNGICFSLLLLLFVCLFVCACLRVCVCVCSFEAIVCISQTLFLLPGTERWRDEKRTEYHGHAIHAMGLVTNSFLCILVQKSVRFR